MESKEDNRVSNKVSGESIPDKCLEDAIELEQALWNEDQDVWPLAIARFLMARDERVRREVWIEAQELSAQCGSRDHTEEAFKLRAWRGE